MIDTYFKVHEHGYVALKDKMGSDESIEQSARMSYGKGTRKRSDTEQLIRYLRRHQHTSPFESVTMTFHVKLPIFVERQWIRHRTASTSEASLRYSEAIDDFYIPKQFLKQSKNNKQGSEGSIDEQENSRNTCSETIGNSFGAYRHLLHYGVSRELARIVLPVSNYTKKFWTVNLHNLFHFLKLRLNPHAQKEIRDYAHVIACIVKEEYPIAFKSFLDYDFNRIAMRHEELHALALSYEHPEEECIDILKEANYSDREIQEWKDKLDFEPVPLDHFDVTKLEKIELSE